MDLSPEAEKMKVLCRPVHQGHTTNLLIITTRGSCAVGETCVHRVEANVQAETGYGLVATGMGHGLGSRPPDILS